MILNRYPNLVHATEALKKRGYKDEYKFEKTKLVNLKTKRSYLPSQMVIVEHHRFEGMTNPGDMSILFALESVDGRKGAVVSSYGPYADMKLVEFLDKVKIKERVLN